MNLKQYLDTLSVEQIKKDVLVLCERWPEARAFFEDKIKERNVVQAMAGEGVPEVVKILCLLLTSGNFLSSIKKLDELLVETIAAKIEKTISNYKEKH